MAKRERAVSAEEEVVKPEATAPAVDETSPVEETKPTKAKKTSWTVYKNGFPVRTYSVEQHGERAESLAHEFCAHSGDEVL